MHLQREKPASRIRRGILFHILLYAAVLYAQASPVTGAASDSFRKEPCNIGPEGDTPVTFPSPLPDSLNVSCDSTWTDPAEPSPGLQFTLYSSFTCRGNVQPASGTLYLFLDADGDSIPDQGEVLKEFQASVLSPGTSVSLSTTAVLEKGWYLACGTARVSGDENARDDFASIPIPVGGGVPPVLTEVMCNPSDEDTGEFIEIYYPGPGIFPLAGCSFTDGDAVDVIRSWNQSPLSDPDAIYSSYLPKNSYGLVLDPEYVTGIEEYDLAESTYVFTVGNTTIGDGLSGNDPITLYDFAGTAQANVLSTYGTPLQNDDPLMCDDDGLDGIPFDPGESHSVQRKFHYLSDREYNWAASPEGGTPGGPAEFTDTLDVSADTLLIFPANPQPGETVRFSAVVLNGGTSVASDIGISIFLDANADSFPQAGELLLSSSFDSLLPGQRDTLSATAQAPAEGYHLAAARVRIHDDDIPENDVTFGPFKSGEGVPLVVTEVLCNPASEDNDEFVELFYPGPGVFCILGCSFTDGDAVDWLEPWDEESGTISDPDAVVSPFLLSNSYAIILDREYTAGTQPYDFPPGTVVLTTGNTTLGDGLSGKDPVTLYRHEGQTWADVMSTYGTPLQNDDPLMCDDDGRDGIPFDPGEDLSVQRKDHTLGDARESWFSPVTGPTPGAPPPPYLEGPNAAGVFMDCIPPMGDGGSEVQLRAVFVNSGTDTISQNTMNVAFYGDGDHDGVPSSGELIGTFACGTSAPGDTIRSFANWNAPEGTLPIFAVSSCRGDSFPKDDTLSCFWNFRSPLTINEIMYAPSSGTPEWVEIQNRSQTTIRLSDRYLEDSEERTRFGAESLLLTPGGFVVITSDSSAFRDAWPGVECPLLQPSSWPTLNNSTQPGKDWADLVILRNGDLQVCDYVPYDDDWGASTGVSLEKTDPELPGYRKSSWAGCLSGGTPGSVNSVCSGAGPPGRFLDCHPDPFSPDGDGVDDLLTIEMNFDGTENEVTLEVYNVQGRLMTRLLHRETCGPSKTVTWNGTDQNGSRLPVGRYILFLSAKSTGGEYREACRVVVLARKL